MIAGGDTSSYALRRMHRPVSPVISGDYAAPMGCVSPARPSVTGGHRHRPGTMVSLAREAGVHGLRR